MINKVVDLMNEIQDVMDEIISINVNSTGEKLVHFASKEKFFEMFNEFDVVEFGYGYKYQWEVRAEIDGVQIFVLLTHEDYDKYVKGAKLIENS